MSIRRAVACNGCGRCVVDCPYSAVQLIPHTLKGTYKMQAQVDAALCASCGICAGACPSSTPFRSVGELVQLHRAEAGQSPQAAAIMCILDASGSS